MQFCKQTFLFLHSNNVYWQQDENGFVEGTKLILVHKGKDNCTSDLLLDLTKQVNCLLIQHEQSS